MFKPQSKLSLIPNKFSLRLPNMETDCVGIANAHLVTPSIAIGRGKLMTFA